MKLIRRKYVTALKYSKSRAFQEKLMQIEGRFEEVDFSKRLPKGGLVALLNSLPSDKVIIFENEADDIFLIGFYKGLDPTGKLMIQFFDGEAKMDKVLSLIKPDDITQVTYDSSYCLHYERFFQRKAK